MPSLRQEDASTRTQEQLSSELVLERPESARQRGLRDVQSEGGTAQGALLGDRDEVTDLVEAHGPPSVLRCSSKAR